MYLPGVLNGCSNLATTMTAPNTARTPERTIHAARPGHPRHSFGLAIGLSLIVLFLGLRQWYERNARQTDLSLADQHHYWHQDTRRWAGVGTLFTIAVLALIGSRIQPGAAGTASLWFVILWFLVLALILILLGLALADLLATRSFAATSQATHPRISRSDPP